MRTPARNRIRDHWIKVLALLLVFGLTVFVSVHLGYEKGWHEHDGGISEMELSDTLARWENAKCSHAFRYNVACILLLPVLWMIHLISPDLAATDVTFSSFLHMMPVLQCRLRQSNAYFAAP